MMVIHAAGLLAVVLGGTAGQAPGSFPDQADIFRGGNRVPQIRLLLDFSTSMIESGGRQTTTCTYYRDTHSGLYQGSTGLDLSRIDQLRASLTGCESADDGVLDRWAGQTLFAIDYYEGSEYCRTHSCIPVTTADELVGWTLSSPPATSSPLAALEAAVLGGVVQNDSGTPMLYGLNYSAQRFGLLNDSNTYDCRSNAVVVMTDGEDSTTAVQASRDYYPGVANFSYLGGPSVSPDSSFRCYERTILPPLTNAERTTYNLVGPTDYPCSGWGISPPYGDAAAYYIHGDPSNPNDALLNVTGDQPLHIYTVGFGVYPQSEILLRDMAEVGGGQYIPATNVESLNAAFEQIITNIQTRRPASFRNVSVQGAGFNSGNYVYQSAFQGSETGHWFGNLKKFCLYPTNTLDTTCFFKWDSGLQDYVINPDPRDTWSGVGGSGAAPNPSNPVTDGYNPLLGGAGAQIFESYGAGTDRDSPVPTSNIYSRRNIQTWNPAGPADYIDVAPSTPGFDEAFTNSRNECAHYALINKLYGYTFDVTPGCSGSPVPNPVAFDVWPLADSVNGGRVLLKYSDECENAGNGDRCFLISVSNAGMLHVFDAIDGSEVQALVPPTFFRPNGAVNESLRDLPSQPTLTKTRRYYFDGGLALYHDDANRNGYIDNSETAYLVAGFGRGGAGYIRFPVSNLSGSGAFDGTNNPPQALMMDHDSGFRNLRDTWAAPWLGDAELEFSGTINRHAVAVFGSGHAPERDYHAQSFGGLQTRTLTVGDSESSPLSVTCAELDIPTAICTSPTPLEICTQIQVADPTVDCTGVGTTCLACDGASCPNPLTGAPCYDWSGYAAYFAGAGAADLSGYGIASLGPLRAGAGPYVYQEEDVGGNVVARARAYRLSLDLRLQPGDRFLIYDDTGAIIYENSGSPGTVNTGWLRTPSFRFEVIGDGVNDGSTSPGWAIAGIDVVRDNVPGAEISFTERPSVWVVDLDRWNGAAPVGWVADPMPSGYQRPGTQGDFAEGVRFRFTSSCDESPGSVERCVDAATFPALANMTCPISAQPTVYSEGGFLRSIYVGDECGQIWAISQTPDRMNWTVRRLLSTNVPDGSNTGPMPVGNSSDFRKIFGKLDLVQSTCTGRRAVGVYFGTGNLQRPADRDLPNGDPANLLNTDITEFSNTNSDPSEQRDVIGVVWDDGSTADLTLEDLVNVSALPSTDPRVAGRDGFFIELEHFEKSLRAPVVLDGYANFQTYEAGSASTECNDASGLSRIYRFDNCTAEPPVGSNPADRVVQQNPASNIGGEMLVVEHRDPGANANNVNGMMVTSGDPDLTSTNRANLAGTVGRAMRLFLWRIDTE